MRVRGAWTWMFAGALAGAACWAAACGSSSDSSQFPGPSGEDAGIDAGTPHTLAGGDAGTPVGQGGHGTLVVSPANATLVVKGPGSTEQYTAMLLGSTAPLTGVAWTVDSPLVGSIGQSGLFTASGTLGGQVVIGAQTESAQGATTLTVQLQIVDDPGGLDGGTESQLSGGSGSSGGADPAFKWLYPYDGTVFPRGLDAPVLQFGGEPATAMMIHAKSTTIDYTAYFGAASPARATFSAAAWSTIIESAAPGDPLTITATKLSASGVAGPITETWSIAPGTLKGTVYYNTYDSPQNFGSGAIMRVKPGQDATILEGGCSVCHTVSANGSTLVTMGSVTQGPADAGQYYYYQLSESYDLTVDGGVPHDQSDSYLGFGALVPDGTLMLSEGAIAGNWPPNVPGIGNLNVPSGDRASKLYDPRAGKALAAPGFDGVISHALMPAFSPDGTKVVFNHYDAGNGHSLAVMDFALSTHTFSNLVDVLTLGATEWAAWPYFAPDSETVIFNTVDWGDYATWDDLGRNSPPHANKGDLQAVDIATKTVTALDSVNGLAGGNVLLPYGAEEAHMNYEPTLLPVAVGGYYWVVFTSRREYGNLLCDATGNGNAYEEDGGVTQATLADGGLAFLPDGGRVLNELVLPSIRKKLWVAAIDINITPGKDPTHPAFYLSGQELAAGNMRGFWALDPCQQNGTACGSGDQCCTGFCRQSNASDGGIVLSCVPKPVGCSNEYEKCTTAADCCGSAEGYQCLNGYCARPPIK